MKILIIGSGGREHAIGLKLSQSPRKPELIFAPGNPGMENLGKCFSIPADNLAALLDLAQAEKIDLTLVGPEVPLVNGIVDLFREKGLVIFGPTKAAAQLEGSKAFSKDFMARHQIPTAAFKNFNSLDLALKYLHEVGAPIVIKASGLAAGKGAIVCPTMPEAIEALESMLGPKAIFGSAGSEVVIEEFMEGEEASIFALTDGKDFVLLPSAQDHKRIGDGDTGPNTGGMGAYSPAPIMTEEQLNFISEKIVAPTLKGMAEEGYPYTGILFVGVMVTVNGPKVVEYNCRLGDPETQVVLPVMENDLLDLILASLPGSKSSLPKNSIQKNPAHKFAAVVVIASEGYPGAYFSGIPIHGLELLEKAPLCHAIHAGTKNVGNQLVTAGGRVLGMVGEGPDLKSAIDAAYSGIPHLKIAGMQFRKDIGKKGLAAMATKTSSPATPT